MRGARGVGAVIGASWLSLLLSKGAFLAGVRLLLLVLVSSQDICEQVVVRARIERGCQRVIVDHSFCQVAWRARIRAQKFVHVEHRPSLMVPD